MNDLHDLEVTLSSHLPLIVIESADENRILDNIKTISMRMRRPLFQWTVTDGLKNLIGKTDTLEFVENDRPSQKFNTEPTAALQHIKSVPVAGIYALLDFHPFLDTPLHVRLLKEIAQSHEKTPRTIILLSHEVEIPGELQPLAARFEMSLPGAREIKEVVTDVAQEWVKRNQGKRIKTDQETLDILVRNLTGLTASEVRRLARTAVCDDGIIDAGDVEEVKKAKYELLNQDGVLSFEYDTAEFADVAGMAQLKRWLDQRRSIFLGEAKEVKLDPPKGILLLGVQGCGKSLAAKAVAGTWGVPLLHLDFGAVYDKFIGETEKNLRESLTTATLMAPCILWLDEIEKGLASTDNDGGTSKRVLGTLLTWMAENKANVFLVATANDIETLPPELVRKGRFDEIFFVDLPDTEVRKEAFAIHLQKREFDPKNFAMDELAARSEGFSGAEIEQAIVSALYSAHAQGNKLGQAHLLEELELTKPLSVVMAEQITYLKDWAAERTVPA